jgi:hypothetical protein
LLHHPLLHPTPCPGHHIDDGRADLRAYSSSEWEIVIDSIPQFAQGIAPTLIFIRMSGLLYTQSGVIHGGVTSVSLPVSIQFGSSGGSGGGTAVLTDPGLRIATEVPKSNIDSEQKPSDGGLGSNLISVENAITE